jgi:hypothetical protein
VKTITVTDALAAELVGKNEAEYAAGANDHIAPPVHEAVAAALPPVVQHAENGKRVDQPCPPGTPGTVTLTKTGHTLSTPLPGENFGGYCDRIWRQAEGVPGVAFAYIMNGSESYFERFGGYKADGSNWPAAADFLFDRHMGRHNYDTDEERAVQAGAQVQWDQTSAAVGHGNDVQQPAPAVVGTPEVQITPTPEQA